MRKFSLALVTGASSGIGEALCHLLASQDIDLLITGRNTAQLDNLIKILQPKVRVISYPADLAKESGRAFLIDKIHDHVPDLVINNAGFGLYGEVLTYDTRQQLDILHVNGTAVLELTMEAARTMLSKEKQGVILNVSSAAAFQIFPSFAIYAAAKAFVNHFSESLDLELKPHGIRVLAACPGMVATQFGRRAAGGDKRRKSSSQAMTSTFAAEQIWWQIQKGKPIHTFDWRYRLASFLTRYILPKKWVTKAVRANIEKRHPPRQIKLL